MYKLSGDGGVKQAHYVTGINQWASSFAIYAIRNLKKGQSTESWGESQVTLVPSFYWMEYETYSDPFKHLLIVYQTGGPSFLAETVEYKNTLDIVLNCTTERKLIQGSHIVIYFASI